MHADPRGHTGEREHREEPRQPPERERKSKPDPERGEHAAQQLDRAMRRNRARRARRLRTLRSRGRQCARASSSQRAAAPVRDTRSVRRDARARSPHEHRCTARLAALADRQRVPAPSSSAPAAEARATTTFPSAAECPAVAFASVDTPISNVRRARDDLRVRELDVADLDANARALRNGCAVSREIDRTDVQRVCPRRERPVRPFPNHWNAALR